MELCKRCGINPIKSKTRCEVCLQKQKHYNEEKRAKWKLDGLCTTCGQNKPDVGKTTCQKCLAAQRRKYERYSANGQCSRCVKNQAVGGKLCLECLKKCKDERDQFKKITFESYGNKCKCCGLTEHVFLSIDHVNNDGCVMRRNKKHPRGGADLCRWLIKKNFPPEFQLLCHNCQWGKHMFGICPHQLKNDPIRSIT